MNPVITDGREGVEYRERGGCRVYRLGRMSGGGVRIVRGGTFIGLRNKRNIAFNRFRTCVFK